MRYADIFIHEVFHFRQVDLIRSVRKASDGRAAELLDHSKGGVCETLAIMWVAGVKNGWNGAQSLMDMKGKKADTNAGQAFWTQAFSQHFTAGETMSRYNESVNNDPDLTARDKQLKQLDRTDKYILKLQTFAQQPHARSVTLLGTSSANPDATFGLFREQRTYIVDIGKLGKLISHTVALDHGAAGYELFDPNFGLAPLSDDQALKAALGLMFEHYSTGHLMTYSAA